VLWIIERHEILRTCFVHIDGESKQIIQDPPEELDLEWFDLSRLTDQRKDEEARRIMREQGRKQWDLEKGPLIRCHVISKSAEDHVINTVFHHIIADGPSVGIFSRELEKIYSGLKSGQTDEIRLPDLSLQYGDYALWERTSMNGAHFEDQLSYWRGILEGSTPLEVPTDFQRPAIHNFQGKKVKFKIDQQNLELVNKLVREERITLFMYVLAIYQLLLSRYSGQLDVLVGSAMTNRIRSELEPLIGLFVNTIPLRSIISGEMSFREFLQQVRQTCLGAFANMELPFEETVRVLQPKRDLSRQGSPLFQHMIINQPPGSQRGETGSSFKPGESHHDTGYSNFDLLLSTHEVRGSSIDCTLAYDTDLFRPDTVERLISRFCNLITASINNPDQKLDDISLITAEEEQLLSGDWSGEIVGPTSQTVLDVIHQHVLNQPDHPALVFGEQELSYRELDQRSTHLAEHLKSFGVEPDMLLGLCLDRGFEMIISILGILKAGAAFVPLDPSYPRQRLQHILSDTDCALIVADDGFDVSLIPPGQQVTLVNPKLIQATPADAPPCEATLGSVDPRSLAYVIFTSGSSGTPKGVLVEHRNLAAIMAAQRSQFELTNQSRVLQMLSISFDAGVGEIFRALTAGATLIQAHKDDLLPGPGLLKLMQQQRVTTVAMSPTALANLPGTPKDLPCLKTLTVGGEACPPQVAQRWGEGCLLLNGYGPTETTIGATLGRQWNLMDTPPLGRPLPGVRTYVLDKRLRPVPPDISGELYIGGVGVTRGYLNRPELTAACFIPDPFVSDPEAKMYKTGDRARWRIDGILEFIGRLDEQVKIRGFRIELGEIEAALSSHPAVNQAVVCVHTHQGNRQLVAYIAPLANQQLDQLELRGFLKDSLPDYMIPALFMILEALPVTSNGKVDRRALPEPDFSSTVLSTVYEAPQTELEQRICEVWLSVLGLSKIGRNDNFFELGGDSISSIRVAARLTSIGLAIDAKEIFKHQCVAELANSLQAESQQISPPNTVGELQLT
jgi:amino acid adenylation domain-containing protein